VELVERFEELGRLKESSIQDFEERFCVLTRSGDVQNFTVKSIYTPSGRRRIVNDLKRRLNRFFRGAKSWRVYMITLTLEGFSSYKKGMFRRFWDSFSYPLRRMKKQGKVTEFFYFWVVELQKRGVPHWHVLVFVPEGEYRANYTEIRGVFSYERLKGLWRYGFSWISAENVSSKRSSTLVMRYVLKYLLKTFNDDNQYRYLGKLLWCRRKFGRFRLYGMSQIKRFKRGVRKKFVEETEKAIRKFQRIKDVGGSLLDWVGVAVKRTGQLVKRYSSWTLPEWVRIRDDWLNWIIERTEMEEMILREFFGEELYPFEF